MAEQRVIVISDPRLSQLNAAHYRVMLAESELNHAKRNLNEADQASKKAQADRVVLVTNISKELGVELVGWNLESGVAQYKEFTVSGQPEQPKVEVVVKETPQPQPA